MQGAVHELKEKWEDLVQDQKSETAFFIKL